MVKVSIMNHVTPNNRRVIPIFSIVLASMIIIFSQSQIAFAGLPCDSDVDGDDFSPCEGDCDDSNKSKYPGHGCEIPTKEINNVINEVQELAAGETITDGQANALLVKLENAIDKIESNNINGAIGSLKAFINQITVFINSGAIQPEKVGYDLISAVQSIIEDLKMINQM